MIRVFITAILYLITMFTQAQEKQPVSEIEAINLELHQMDEEAETTCEKQGARYARFQHSEFEVNDKDLTFDRRY